MFWIGFAVGGIVDAFAGMILLTLFKINKK